MAYDLAPGGARLGPYTLKRCEAALDAYWRYSNDRKPLIVLGAGFADRVHFPDQLMSMAENMREYFKDNGIDSANIRVGDMTGNPWGSGAEIVSALMAAHDAGTFCVVDGDPKMYTANIRIVTSAFHTPRCLRLAYLAFDLIASRKAPECLSFPRIGALKVWHPLSYREHLKEYGKRAVTLGLSLAGDSGRRKLGVTLPSAIRF